MNEFEQKLLAVAPAVWFLAALLKDNGLTDEQERVLTAARQFKKLSDQDARDCEAVGRAIGVALGILAPRELSPLDQGWTPDWLIQIRDERNDELDWEAVVGFVTRNFEIQE